jgi:hypothetical protein
MFHSLIARPLESNEPITNLIGLIKINLREFNEPIINLANLSG